MLTLAYVLLATAIPATSPPRFDVAISETLHGWSSPALDRFMMNVTVLGDSITANAVTLLAGLGFVWRRQFLAALVVATTTPAGQLLVRLLKEASSRDRPDLFPPLEVVSSYSFPSGHTFAAALAWGLVAGIAAARFTGPARWLPWLGWTLIVGVVGASRIYLGVHYASDVAGSLLVGIAWIIGWLAVIDRITTPNGSTAASGSTVRDGQAPNHPAASP